MLRPRFPIFILSLVSAFAVGFFEIPQARATSTAELAAGADLIAAALNTPGANSEDILKKIVNDLRQKLGICKPTTLLRETALSICLIGDGKNPYRGKLYEYLRYTFSSGKIDAIELAILNRLASRIDTIKVASAEVTLLDESALESTSWDASRDEGVPLPPLLTYRKNKANFAALRKVKGKEEKLPEDLLKQMSKSFVRKVQGVGGVNAEQYFAAQMGRLELNRLAGLMVSAADFLVRPDARIVFYPANHEFSSDQLKSIEQQELDLARSILAEDSEEQRTALRAQLKELESRASLLRADSPADELMNERAVKSSAIHDTILLLARVDVSASDREEIKRRFEDLVGQLNAIDEKLAKIIRTKQVAPEDVQRFALNALQSDFTGLMQERPFNQLGLQVADALLAAWVAGDISSEGMRVLSAYPTMTEKRTSVWQKALKVSWSIGKTAMMVFPSTAYLAIAISIYEEVQNTSKEIQEKKSNETHIIPLLQ